MNIDLNALKAIEEQQGIPMDDLLGTIANALLFSYREFKEGEADEAAKARVDIDTETGNVAVIVSELNADGEVISEYDDTPVNFSRIGSVAVRDAIKGRLRQAEAGRVYDEYAGFEGKVVSGIVQRDAAGQIEAVDRQRSQVEGPARRRPVDPPLRIEPEIERQAVDGELVGAHLAAHQGAQAELDVEIGGADLAEVVGAADGDGFQPQRWRGQQTRVKIAGDANRRADDLGRLRLELRPELVPVNEIRTDQRSDQCKNEGDCQAEQRRLHGVSL